MDNITYFCPNCGHEFKQGEWDYNYDTALLDFECPECGWEGNEHGVLDEETIVDLWDDFYDDETLARRNVEIVTWPESQDLMMREGFRANSWLINDMEGLDLFGSSAYVVDKGWYNKE